ncbi:MAG: GNAT family N-acetyltransferase [Sphaerochaeta sp.]
MKIETERLLLREMTEWDYPSLAEILQDDQTMYAYEGAFSDEETRAWLEKNIKRYETDGFGLWALILKETGAMIGQAGLTWQAIKDTQVLEIGYLLNRKYWKMGYAVEAAKACKEYAFKNLSCKEVYSIIRETNLASMNVAIRTGMLARDRFIKEYRGIAMPHLVFSVKNTSTL